MRSKGVTTAALVTAIGAAVVMSLYATLLFILHCVDGDGGVPYTARSSPQKGVCDVGLDGWLVLPLMLAVAGGVAYLANGALRDWRERRGSGLLAIVLTLGVVAAPALAFGAVNLPRDHCSDEQLAENDAWEAEGSRGEPPHDCDAY